MNPYASHLGDRDPLDVLAATSGRLQTLVSALGREGVEWHPSPGKWCVREILCHLADTESAFAFRLRQSLAEPHHVIQPFDQDLWSRYHAAYDVHLALQVFTVIRGWNVRLLGIVPPPDYSKPVTHPERGTMTFRVLVETMAGHDLNHLKQVEAIATKRGAAQ